MSRASRKEARQERLRLEFERLKAEARERPRPWYVDVTYPGAGVLLVQVLFRASWGPWMCWEIRQLGEHDFALYGSASESHESDLLVGYEKLQANSENLESFVKRLHEIKSLPIPVPRPFVRTCGFSDRQYGIAIFDRWHSCSRFHWNGDIPNGWHLLAHLTEVMISNFSKLPLESERPN